MKSSNSLRELEDSFAAPGAAGDALDLLRRSWPALVPSHGPRIRALMDSAPASAWDQDPWLVAAYASSFRSVVPGSRSAAVTYFLAAQSLITPDTTLAVRVEIALRYSVALRVLGRLDDALEAVDAATLLLDVQLGLAERIRLESGIGLSRGMILYHLGDLDGAKKNLLAATGLAQGTQLVSDRVECLAGLALVSYSLGDFGAARNYAEKTRAECRDTDLLVSCFGAPALIAELLVAVEQDRLDDAHGLTDSVVSACARNDWTPLGFYAAAARSIISEAYVEGLELLGHCVRTYSPWQPAGSIATISEGLRATLLLRLGEVDIAWAIFAALSPTQHHANCPARFIAHLRFITGDARGAADALIECEALGDRHSARTMVDVQLLKAAANYELNNVAAADLAFDRSMRLAARNDLRIPFRLVPDDVMSQMIARAGTRGQSPAVRALFGEVRGSVRASLGGTPRLTEREREIVRLMVHGSNTPKIAKDLFISINTVKSHLKSIYRKFGVRTREDATKRARELGFHV